MSTRLWRLNQLREYRREGIYKHSSVARPASGIRQMDDRAAPVRPQKRARHVPFDRTQQSCNHCGLEFLNHFRKRSLADDAGGPARFRIEVIHRASTQIDQIATRSLKDREKILIINRVIDHSEGVAHRPVEAGVSLVEKAPGRGSRFADEQQTHVVGTKRAPQFFSLPACGIKRQRGLLSLPDRLESRRPPGPRN